ncbi:MAG TPA: hypothetical protein VN493_27355 [Thermoanaerobaculia bacterium]|nr:hypothetical protein [Thermoanaerobaculia bacterium]
MVYDVTDLAKALLLLSRGVLPEDYPHPDQGILLAYLECRLSDDVNQKIREHVSFCGLCTGLLLDWQEDFEEQIAANLDEEWSRFRESLSREEQKLKALRALERLASLREGLPPVDAVEVIRSVRDEPADRETD